MNHTMKKLWTIISTFLIIHAAAAQEKKFYEGRFESGNAFCMWLDIEKSTLKGFLFFLDECMELEISGTKDKNGDLTFSIYDKKGKKQSEVKGSMSASGGVIDAVITDTLQKNKQPFVANETGPVYNDLLKECLSIRLKLLSGKYSSIPEESTYDYRLLELQYTGDMNFEYHISMAAPNGCVHDVKGNGVFKSSDYALIQRDECVLKLTFDGKKLTIEEENCMEERGINCSYAGEYFME